MSIKAGVGMSQHHNPNVAGREAAGQALEMAGISKPDFVFMFGSIGYDQHSLLGAVRVATGGASLTGCSAAGTINGDDADESNFSVVVTVISSDELHWTNGIATGLEDDPPAVGKQVAEELLPHLSADTIGLFVFPDGLTENFDHFIAGLEENLPNDQFLPLWGGGAGHRDFNAEAPTFQYCDEEVVSDGVSYALLSGEAQTAWAISHSVIPIGGERLVTRSEGNVIYEIDGKPATDVLKEQLGGEQPELVFQFECVTRGQLMFREQEKLQILKQFRQSVGPDVPWVGFYTIGEIAPVEEHNDIHRLGSAVLALS